MVTTIRPRVITKRCQNLNPVFTPLTKSITICNIKEIPSIIAALPTYEMAAIANASLLLL
jgi:hypothetical protein